VRFSVESFSALAAHCHCSQCRKFHGAAFATLVETTGLNWLGGEEYLTEFTGKLGATRTFCSCCGSSIGFRPKGAAIEQTEIAIALFDDPIPVTPDAHIHTASGANWYDAEKELPVFRGARE
jgi:hypothetical protein